MVEEVGGGGVGGGEELEITEEAISPFAGGAGDCGAYF